MGQLIALWVLCACIFWMAKLLGSKEGEGMLTMEMTHLDVAIAVTIGMPVTVLLLLISWWMIARDDDA